MAAAAAPYITRTLCASRGHHALLHSGITRQRRTAAPYIYITKAQVNVYTHTQNSLHEDSCRYFLFSITSWKLPKAKFTDVVRGDRGDQSSVLEAQVVIHSPTVQQGHQRTSGPHQWEQQEEEE
ncbi:hypothetical protein STEG23_033965, partial [Scotinomys teguina]